MRGSAKEAEKYEDKGIFWYGLSYIQYHETILAFLKKETSKGNSFFFPSKEFGTIIILDKSHDKSKFLIYDVFKNDIIRRLPK